MAVAIPTAIRTPPKETVRPGPTRAMMPSPRRRNAVIATEKAAKPVAAITGPESLIVVR